MRLSSVPRSLLGACKVFPDTSPQFAILREHWRKSGYPSVETDLIEAFNAIKRDVKANHCAIVPRFASVLGKYQLHKYRQKNKAASEGARGGWRIYALYDKEQSALYPIIVYPKKVWEDAQYDHVTKCVEELLKILQQPPLPGASDSGQ
jgi:hypothetical protein